MCTLTPLSAVEWYDCPISLVPACIIYSRMLPGQRALRIRLTETDRPVLNIIRFQVKAG